MDDLEIIQRVMDQHKVFIDQFEAVCTVMSDKDALIVMEKAQAELGVDFRRGLEEKRAKLIDMLKSVDKGLRNHYTFEEQTLPPLLGPLLTEALIIEHENLISEANTMISTIANANTKGLSHFEEIGQEAIFSGMLNKLRDDKMDHLEREEAILITLKMVCEIKAQAGK